MEVEEEEEEDEEALEAQRKMQAELQKKVKIFKTWIYCMI